MISHLAIGGHIFDVTTIYEVAVDDSAPESSVDVSTDADAEKHKSPSTSLRSCSGVRGHVHSRTNALGMGLTNSDNYNVDFKITDIPAVTCDTSYFENDEVCGLWEQKDGIEVKTFTELPGLPIKNGAAYKIRPNTTLEFQDIKRYTYLYFTNGPGSLQQNKIAFLIKFYGDSGDGDPAIFYNCKYHEDDQYSDEGFRKYAVPDRDESRDGRIYCEDHNGFIPFDYDHDILAFTFSKDDLNENVKIFRGLHPMERKLVLDWDFNTFVDYENVNYFSLSPSNPVDYNSTTLSFSVIDAAEITSPAIIPQSNKLCLAMVFHSSSTNSQSQLEIYALDLVTNNRTLLKEIFTVEKGVNIKYVHASLDNSNPVKIKIKQVGSVNVGFSRISSCNTNGEEVFDLLDIPTCSTDSLAFGWQSLDLHYNYTTIPDLADPAKEIEPDNKKCWHGGVSTSAGCACTPSFTGSHCQTGCGRNRFGQDCEGQCYLRHDCRGLVMCNKFTGCHCAAGYTGRECTKACPPGWYGNDCSEQCGNCAGNSTCDVYTGECTSCKQGYLAPHCRLVSVYYGSVPEVTSSSYNTVTVSFDARNYVTVDEPPQFYQIQYREKERQWVVYTTKQFQVPKSENGNNITESIEGLNSGTFYQIRILLMNDYFSKYDGDLIKVAEIVTKCDIPSTYNYKLAANSNSTAIDFSWVYLTEDLNLCPVERFEVKWKEGWKWKERYTKEPQFTIIGLLPGGKVEFKVRAVTTGGPALYSKTMVISTQQTELPPVRNLRLASRQSTSVNVLWEPPRGIEDSQLRYTISYKCIDRPACADGCQNVTEGYLTQEKHSVILSPLLPFTQYLVTVSAVGGVESSIYVGTTGVAPTELPILSAQRPVRTNTSVTVFWNQGPVCTGYLLGYNYQLTKASNPELILASGFTKYTSTSFINLTAGTEYIAKVFVSTVMGWNSQTYLTINVSTSATVPEAVRNLTVYKRGRSMLGLRWAQPKATYGQLKSFTVTYSLGQDTTSHTVEPSHCVVWPDLYCHTIEGLKSNRPYNITISARNSEVAEDGELVSVSAITKESPPSAPVNLKVTNSSSTSIELEWNFPEMPNGIVRSFLISVEETEKYDQDSCCQVYPFVETPVKEEQKTYSAEVSGLHPASTYFVSVSSKTVGLGPAQSLVAYTRPPNLPLTSLPRTQVVPESSWLPQEKLPEVNNFETYTSVVRTHLLLAVLNESQLEYVAPESGIMDPKLDALLQQKIGKPFYFIAEYEQDEVVEVSETLEDRESLWGRPPDSLSSMLTYQLVATQVLEYNGVYNVDLRYSQPFTL